jgi:ferredoxin
VNPDLCIGCGICETKCPVVDRPAIYVTAINESREQKNQLFLGP